MAGKKFDPIEAAKLGEGGAPLPPVPEELPKVETTPPLEQPTAKQKAVKPPAGPPPGKLPEEPPVPPPAPKVWKVMNTCRVRVQGSVSLYKPGKLINEGHYPPGTVERLREQGCQLELVAS